MFTAVGKNDDRCKQKVFGAPLALPLLVEIAGAAVGVGSKLDPVTYDVEIVD